jgi:hypothetical protein
MSNEVYGRREAQRMTKSIADDPKALDWSEHIRRVSQGNKAPHRVSYPPLVSPPRAILDKVGSK